MIPQRIIWHHSAVDKAEPQFEDINNYHKQQQFPLSSLGYYVGYHWLIEKDGTIRQARAETEIGAHDAGENPNSLGICLAGNFSLKYPTPEQEASAAKLVGEIRGRWKIPVSRIEPHRWDDQTECPGTRLSDHWLTTIYLEREANPLARAFLWIGKSLDLL